MHLITALAAGVRGAENGSASILKRGLTSRATYYTSFEGGAVTPSGDVALDSNGGGVFYVNEFCDVVCKDEDGNIVRTFTAGDSSPAVEVVSQSFTGVDYDTGASGASKPTTLQAALDKLKTSFGTTDFNVLVSGTATALQTAVANSITSLFFNVKASTYGAVGDGSTDDSTAIAAAITAASAAGGGTVYFPKGTYKVLSALTVPAGVSLLGSGAGASTIANGASPFMVAMTGTVGQWTYVRDLNLDADRTPLAVHSGWVRVEGCRLKSGLANNAAIYTDDANSRVVAFGCTLETITSGYHINVSSGYVQVIGCVYVFPSGAYAGSSMTGGAVLSVVASTFKLGTVTSGTSTLFDATNGQQNVIGNIFESVGGAGTPVVNVHNTSLYYLSVEVGNYFGSGYTFPVLALAAAANAYSPVLSARASRYNHETNNTSPVAIPTSVYGMYQVVRTNNAAQTLTFSDPPGPGHWFQLVFNNNQAGASGTITMGGTNIRGLASFTAVTANTMSIYTFRSVYVAAPTPKFVWSLTSSDINEAP